MIIGLTGARGSGKTTVADYLRKKHGFIIGHTFRSGKEMCEAYFYWLGVPKRTAKDMVNGKLRDVPCALLPNNHTPRYLMERLGFWMGTELGPAWTLGTELNRFDRICPPGTNYVFESVVYEAALLKYRGGIIVKLGRTSTLQGLHTDAAVNNLTPDFVLENNGPNVEALYDEIENLLLTIKEQEK